MVFRAWQLALEQARVIGRQTRPQQQTEMPVYLHEIIQNSKLILT